MTHKSKAVIFLHMPKTAGTTFYDAIKFQYRKREIFTCSGIIENSVEMFNQLPDVKKQQIKFFKGHMTFGLHQFLTQPSTYISILRHPTKRFISLYYYLQQSTTHAQHHHVVGKSLHDFAQNQVIHHNFQTRFIAGRSAFDSACSDEEKLAIAKANIDTHFAAIGIQERFDESLILFKHVLGWKNLPLYVRQNKSKKPDHLDIEQSTIDLIEEKNSLDMQLYDYANQKLDQEIAKLDTEFVRSLDNFKKANRLYAPIGKFYSHSRSLTLNFLKSVR